MKICSKQSGLVIKSNFPKFKYKFPKADEPVEVDEKHTDKILRNPTFYKFTSSQSEPSKSKNLNKSEAKK